MSDAASQSGSGGAADHTFPALRGVAPTQDGHEDNLTVRIPLELWEMYDFLFPIVLFTFAFLYLLMTRTSCWYSGHSESFKVVIINAILQKLNIAVSVQHIFDDSVKLIECVFIPGHSVFGAKAYSRKEDSFWRSPCETLGVMTDLWLISVPLDKTSLTSVEKLKHTIAKTNLACCCKFSIPDLKVRYMKLAKSCVVSKCGHQVLKWKWSVPL